MPGKGATHDPPSRNVCFLEFTPAAADVDRRICYAIDKSPIANPAMTNLQSSIFNLQSSIFNLQSSMQSSIRNRQSSIVRVCNLSQRA
jgi:hypothetical protein